MTQRIVFRADASHARGFGHVARLAALVEACSGRGVEPVAMFGGEVAAVRAWAKARGIAAIEVGAIEDPRVVAVVSDGAAQPRLPRGVKTVVIDDRGGYPAAVDVVVNHNVHAAELAATYPAAARRLLGRRYLMLRDDVRRRGHGSAGRASAGRLRVVVSFGGSDPVGATARVVAAMPEDRQVELIVLAGPGFRDEGALREAVMAAEVAGHAVEVVRDPVDPGGVFAQADAAICSAGGTLGELAFLGCPGLAYAIAEDQVAPARHQARARLIAGGRRWEEAVAGIGGELRGELRRFLLDDAGRAVVRARALETADGDGPRRILDEILA